MMSGTLAVPVDAFGTVQCLSMQPVCPCRTKCQRPGFTVPKTFHINGTFRAKCHEHDVRPSVCNVGGLWSHSARKSGNRHRTGQIGRCLDYLHADADPDRRGMWKIRSFALLQHPTARMLRYLSIYWAFCFIFGTTVVKLSHSEQFHIRYKIILIYCYENFSDKDNLGLLFKMTFLHFL